MSTRLDQNTKGPSIDSLSLLELYLLSMAVGIPLAKESRGYLQAFMDAVFYESILAGIKNHARIMSIALGAEVEMADQIRAKAINGIAAAVEGNLAQFHDIKLIIDNTYKQKVDRLMKVYKEFLLTVPRNKLSLFEELAREWFCLHGAMMIKGAFGLRKYHIGDSELNIDAILNHFLGGIKQFVRKIDEMDK